MKLWIARDKEGCLSLTNYKPERGISNWKINADNPKNFRIELNVNEYSEVTWENSPQEVELKLIEK